MKVTSIEEIKNALQPIANELNVELVDVEFKQGREPALTVFIDTETGVDLNTCETFHRAIDPVLDELDPTFGAPYTLNVSSPGLDRAFKTARDFERNIGKKVEVKLFAPLKGKKFFEAELVAYDGNCVMLKDEKSEFKLEINKIAKINKAITFDF
ncbi:MAG: ribosome maturation factor RimP [Clostridiales bacterium]|nr:ribosome maturation factor RimP [Clostridiales bacterium]